MLKKLLYGFIVIILAAVVVIFCGLGSAVDGKWFQNGDIQTWYNNWWQNSSKGEQGEAWGGVIDNVGNELNAETTYAMPAAMAFYARTTATLAEQLEMPAPTVTVTCSHNFEFNNVFVDWSVEYPSGASAADVVTVTPADDGSLTATVTCKSAFDQPLTLKATLRGNEEKTATCTIDYVKRIDNLSSITICGSDFDDQSGVACKPVFSIGTVTGNLKASYVSYSISDSFQSLVKSYLKFNINFKSYIATNITLDDKYYEGYGEIWKYSMFIENFDTYDTAHKNAIYYAWRTAFFNSQFLRESNVILDATIDVLYNGQKIQSYQETDYIGTSPNQLMGDLYGLELSPDLTLNTNIAL